MQAMDITSKFVERFKKMADKNFDAPSKEHKALELSGKEFLKTGISSTLKPKDISYTLWDDIKFYLTDLSQYDVIGENLAILGFIPVWIIREAGEITKFRYDLTMKSPIEGAISESFKDNIAENIADVKVSNFVVTHEQLSSANPEQIYELFNSVIKNGNNSEYWYNPELKVVEEDVCSIFIPFVVYMDNNFKEDFHFSDIFAAENANPVTREHIKVIWNYLGLDSDSEFDAGIQYGKPEALSYVVEEGETERDLVVIEMALEGINSDAKKYANGMAVKLTAEVYWPVEPGTTIGQDTFPTLRLAINSRVIDDDGDNEGEYEFVAYNIHIPQYDNESWGRLLTKLLKLCYEKKFPYVTVAQYSSSNLIKAWQNTNESMEVH